MLRERLDVDELKLAGLTLRGGLTKQGLASAQDAIRFIVTVNCDFIARAQTDARLASIISSNTATLDGQVTVWLATIFGEPSGVEFEKLSGVDIAMDLVKEAACFNKRVFLLGSTETVNNLAVKKLSKEFGIDVKGFSPPHSSYPFSEETNRLIMTMIRNHRPHLLLVGLGSPKQEYWIEDVLSMISEAGVETVVGCGGTLEFLSGTIPRAPLLVQKMGLESIYRLLVEPKWFRVVRIVRSFGAIPAAMHGWSLRRRENRGGR